MRRLLPLLVIITILFGASYASAVLYRLMGPFTAIAIERDGNQTHMEFGVHLPRPEWVPVYPGATVVQASKLTSLRAPSGFHSLELATRASLEEVKRFYTRELIAAGFEVEDHGIAPLNPLTAAYLGMAGTLSGRRAATDDLIDIQIRAPDGLIASRLLQIHWRKSSELVAPRMPPAPVSGS
jgi:hypothetical protein